MEEITPEQKGQLKTWAGQRDAILLEISNLQTAKEKLEVINKNLANSNTDIETRMNQIAGRIEELKKKELELPTLILKEVSDLQTRKNVLESEITNLRKIVDILASQKTSLEKDVALALSTFDTVKKESLSIEKIVDQITKVNKDNLSSIDDFIKNLKESIEELVVVNKKNVSETNVVIDKLPKMLVEIQKRGLIRNKI